MEATLPAVPCCLWLDGDGDLKQISMLLYCLGEEADSVFMSTNPTEDDRKRYETVITKFDEFFKIRKNVYHTCSKNSTLLFWRRRGTSFFWSFWNCLLSFSLSTFFQLCCGACSLQPNNFNFFNANQSWTIKSIIPFLNVTITGTTKKHGWLNTWERCNNIDKDLIKTFLWCLFKRDSMLCTLFVTSLILTR